MPRQNQGLLRTGLSRPFVDFGSIWGYKERYGVSKLSYMKGVDMRQMCVLVVMSWIGCLGARGADLVPFVIPLEVNADSPLAWPVNSPIGPDAERVIARDGHFYHRGEPMRIWGVNLSFGANFPSHGDARRVAARLAHVGVNSVRFHHMDTAVWPRGIWDAENPARLSRQALDRLDYFVDQLARVGIYANINLHVGRAHSQHVKDVPATEHGYDKVYNLFTPALIEAQRGYARSLLTHVNAYRGVTYASDPAVAFVEITNENSFFMWNGDETLRSLKPYYATLLQTQYNRWLEARYGAREKLARAWSQGVSPLEESFLRNGDLSQMRDAVPLQWHLEQHNGNQASILRQDQGIRVEILKHDSTGWHLQFNQGNLSLEQGQYYTVILEARSDQGRKLGCQVGQAHEPWKGLGLSRTLELTSKWQRFELGFVAGDSDVNARVSFAFGGEATAFELRRLEMRAGGQVGLEPNESWDAGTIKLYADNESEPRELDRWMFLAETEKDFFDQMRGFIKNDLRCEALVTGTIVFGPLGLYGQSDMDFVDAHAYWQHPQFPGKPWDAGNWIVKQKPLVDYPQEATLFSLAAQRLADKPFTVSEYNHPAPLDSQAACVPMLSAFAAAQDWDGIWLYTYSHSQSDWGRSELSRFFDIDSNPAKWGFMRSGADIFRHGAVEVLGHRSEVALTESAQSLVNRLAQHQRRFGSDLFGALASEYSMGRSNLMTVQLSARLSGASTIRPVFGAKSQMTWGVEEGQGGLFAVESDASRVAVGHSRLFSTATQGAMSMSSPEHIALTVTSLDGRDLDQTQKILVVACGRCENTGMVFTKDRGSVGRHWGQGPVLIEPVEGAITLPRGRWRAWALDVSGGKRETVTVRNTGPVSEIVLAESYATMWYLVERESR